MSDKKKAQKKLGRPLLEAVNQSYRLSMLLNPDLVGWYKKEAKRSGTKYQSLIRDVLKAYADQRQR
jgi:uncharacterized protein (DUF4415 family)